MSVDVSREQLSRIQDLLKASVPLVSREVADELVSQNPPSKFEPLLTSRMKLISLAPTGLGRGDAAILVAALASNGASISLSELEEDQTKWRVAEGYHWLDQLHTCVDGVDMSLVKDPDRRWSILLSGAFNHPLTESKLMV